MKEPTHVIILKSQIIHLFDETDYDIDSMDNLKSYEECFINGDKECIRTFVGVEVYEGDNLVSSCLLGAEGGGIGISDNTSRISYGGLVICCSNTVFKLSLPDLELEWMTMADSITCFAIDYLEEDYIVHGEMEITRLDSQGEVVWKFGGGDIWTTAEGRDDFIVHENYIEVTDWEYNRFKLDFDGNIIKEYKVKPTKQVAEINDENKRNWWRIW